MVSAFSELAAKLPATGNLIIWHDDPNRSRIQTKALVTTFGLSPDADVTAHNIGFNDTGCSFDVILHGQDMGCLQLAVSGKHNILDALAAIALTSRLGVPSESILQALSGFNGTKRRFERLGTRNGAVIVDDYAHHPTEIQTTWMAPGVLIPGGPQDPGCIPNPNTFKQNRKIVL